MFKEGLGEGTRFSQCHPIVNLTFYTFALVITMFSVDPVFVGVTLIMSWVYSILLKGKAAVKFNIIFMVPMIIFMSLINALFTHNGETVLFFLNNQRITLEAIIFGFIGAMLLSAVIIWFSSFNTIMTSDKLIYIFGKAAPVLGLTLSMVFRFIPLLMERFREIRMGQKCMGREEEKKFLGKVRQLAKEVSILISWSLEAAIETSDSMEARGYGLKGRTSFHLFKMSPYDWKVLFLVIMTGGISFAGLIMKKTTIYYYPTIVFMSWDIFKIITLAAYIILLACPIVIDIIGEKKWHLLKLEA